MRVSKKTLEQIEAALPSMKNEVELPNMPPETNLPSALRELREMVEAGIHSRCAKRVRVRQDGGPGGFIDTYKEDGTLIGTFAKGFPLNQPWRYAWAPGEFRPLEQHLAGLQQTDTGTINAFNAKGQFVGTTKRGGPECLSSSISFGRSLSEEAIRTAAPPTPCTLPRVRTTIWREHLESLFPEVRVIRGAINRVIMNEDESRFSKGNENLGSWQGTILLGVQRHRQCGE